ncbi:MAG: hypothetical protein ABIF12_03130 [bacterium]
MIKLSKYYKVAIFIVLTAIACVYICKQAFVIFYIDNESSPEPYSYKLDKEIHKLAGGKPPYAALFYTSKTKLMYIATNHTTNIQSKTFAWIKTAIDDFKPRLIIFEGVKSTDGYSPKDIIDSIDQINHLSKTLNVSSDWSRGEHIYAAYLGQQNSIPFLGGEVDDQVIFDRLNKDGYSDDDIIFFYFSRQIPQLYREGLISKQDDLEFEYSKFIKKLMNKLEFKTLNALYFEKYKIWINKHFGKFDFKILIDSNNTAPIFSGNFLQKISSRIGIIRDKHIIDLISNNTGQFSKILIVYGASHLSTQYGVLSKMFGPATFYVNVDDYKKMVSSNNLCIK